MYGWRDGEQFRAADSVSRAALLNLQRLPPLGTRKFETSHVVGATGRTPPIPRSALEKDSDAGRDWGQEEKGTTEDEMAGWHH